MASPTKLLFLVSSKLLASLLFFGSSFFPYRRRCGVAGEAREKRRGHVTRGRRNGGRGRDNGAAAGAAGAGDGGWRRRQVQEADAGGGGGGREQHHRGWWRRSRGRGERGGASAGERPGGRVAPRVLLPAEERRHGEEGVREGEHGRGPVPAQGGARRLPWLRRPHRRRGEALRHAGARPERWRDWGAHPDLRGQGRGLDARGGCPMGYVHGVVQEA